MTIEEARDIINTCDPKSHHYIERAEWEVSQALHILLDEAYKYLEEGNKHLEIMAIEFLTGISYE